MPTSTCKILKFLPEFNLARPRFRGWGLGKGLHGAILNFSDPIYGSMPTYCTPNQY